MSNWEEPFTQGPAHTGGPASSMIREEPTTGRTTLMPRPGKFLLTFFALCCVSLAGLATAATAGKGMRSVEVGNKLCKTTGGGRFVDIPDFPGEEIDRRLLKDIRWMEKRWDIFVSDGYSNDGVHAANGEHPLGLALDIVPNKAAGGTWKKIDRLAAWAEPRQNQPRAPFRWVGYDGDAGHGRKNHLHLSYSHSDAKPYHPAKTIYTVNCPKSRVKTGGGGGGNGGGGGKGGNGGGGGVGSGGSGSTGGTGAGGIGARSVMREIQSQQANDSSVETGGEGF